MILRCYVRLVVCKVTYACAMGCGMRTYTCAMGCAMRTYAGAMGCAMRTYACAMGCAMRTYACAMGCAMRTYACAMGYAIWGCTLVRWVAWWGHMLVRCGIFFSVVTRDSWTWVDKRQWHNWMTLLELGTSQFTCWGCWFSWWCWWCMFVCLWGHIKPIWKSINVFFSVGSNSLGEFWDSTNAMQPKVCISITYKLDGWKNTRTLTLDTCHHRELGTLFIDSLLKKDEIFSLNFELWIVGLVFSYINLDQCTI